MLILTIVAFFATTAFYSAAKRRGLPPGRAAMLPFMVLGIFLIFAHFGGLLLGKLLELAEASSFVDVTICFAFNLLLLCTYLGFIRKNWLALCSYPVSDGVDD